MRSALAPDSTRGGVISAPLDEHVLEPDRPSAEAHIALVGSAPGAALFVWGPDATCIAYNRAFRILAGLRVNAAGKPFLRAQPDLERAWRSRLDLALGGTAATIDGSAFVGGPEAMGGEGHMGWLLPVAGPSGARGVIALFMDAAVFVEPTRRLVGALAADLREPVIGIQVVSERLSRIPKPTRERCVEDMDRVLDHTRSIERLVDDMAAYARRSTAGGAARLSARHGDLGTIVRLACERIETLAAGARTPPSNEPPSQRTGSVARPVPPLRVNVTEVYGLWDDEAILRILSAVIASARQSTDGASVAVELNSGRDGAVLTVKDDGPPLRSDDAEQLFEPWKRGLALGVERRRRGVGLGLFLARELVHAHGGRIAGDRGAGGGFVVRITLPVLGASAPPVSRSYRGPG